jgi:phage head maturation protease
MTDLSKLSYKELQQLEKQIEERKYELITSKDCVEGYKITFCVKFNPASHVFDELRNAQEFGDYLANDVANLIIKDFGLTQSDVSGFEVEEMTDEYKVEWKDFWENDDD